MLAAYTTRTMPAFLVSSFLCGERMACRTAQRPICVASETRFQASTPCVQFGPPRAPLSWAGQGAGSLSPVAQVCGLLQMRWCAGEPDEADDPVPGADSTPHSLITCQNSWPQGVCEHQRSGSCSTSSEARTVS